MNFSVVQSRVDPRNVLITVLYRSGGRWQTLEVNRLVNRLKTQVSENPEHPEHLILLGHFTKQMAVQAIGGNTFITVKIIGANSSSVPFVPSFV